MNLFAKRKWRITKQITLLQTYCSHRAIVFRLHENGIFEEIPAYCATVGRQDYVGVHRRLSQSAVVPAILHELGHFISRDQRKGTKDFEAFSLIQKEYPFVAPQDIPLSARMALYEEEVMAWRFGKELAMALRIKWTRKHEDTESSALDTYKAFYNL